MVDDFSRLVDVDLSTFDRIVMKSSSDVFVPDGGPAPLYGYTLKNARSLILTKHQIVVTFWGHFLGLTSDKIQGEWNEDRYQKRHLDVF